jgi:hypothetical protein
MLVAVKQYNNKIRNMKNEDLKEETKEKIWSSAFWNRTPNHESHKQVDACYSEWVSRDGNNQTYRKLHKEVRKEFTR